MTENEGTIYVGPVLAIDQGVHLNSLSIILRFLEDMKE